MRKQCPICGKKYYFKPCYIKIRRGQTCSVKCGGINKRGKSVPKRKTGKYIYCKICKKEFYVIKSRLKTKKYCSEKCFNKSKIELKGSKAAHWKGGRYKNCRGYIFIYSPNHPYCNRRYVKQANLVMEKFLGRYLIPPELVHHKNSIPDDDRIENLKLFSNHSKHLSKI